MSDWWYVIAIAGLAAVVGLYLRSRGSRSRPSSGDRQAGEGPRPDFAQDREDNRLAHMSEADRDWEAASLQTNRDAQGQGVNPAEVDVPPERPNR